MGLNTWVASTRKKTLEEIWGLKWASIGRARWMRNLIPHPTSTHTAYFWWTPLPQKQEIPEKMWWWHHHHIFSGISCFWGIGVHKKYAKWVLIGWKIKFRIQRALPIEIWLKTWGDISKIQTKKVSSSKINKYYFIILTIILLIFFTRPILSWNFL